MASIVEGKARALQRERELFAWHAWHVAAMPRMKRFPRLKDILPSRKQKPRRKKSWQDMLRIAELINAMSGGVDRRKMN